MQIVKGFVCMNCTDVERAQKGIDPAHPDQPATVAGPRDGASETSSPAGTLTQNAVSFGGGCVNNTAWYFTNHYIPFGGVGNSGMGAYHGKYGFILD